MITLKMHHSLYPFQIDKALEVFEKNGLTVDDWYPVVHTDDCVYDKDPSVWTCKNEWD